MRKKNIDKTKMRRKEGRRFGTVPLPWFLGLSTIHDHQENSTIIFSVTTEGPKREGQIWRAIEKYPIV